MELGLIARADHRGLSIQTASYYRALHPARTMIVDCPSRKPLPLHLEQFPGDGVSVIEGLPSARDFANWLPGLDTVLTAECPYDFSLYSIAAELGIKTVLAVNPEFCDHIRRTHLPAPSLFACPSTWMWDRIPSPKCLLPVPVETDRFTPQAADKAVNFLHVVGRPAIHDRAGTADTLQALRLVKANVTVTITCQERGYVRAMVLAAGRLPDNINLRICDGDVPNYWDLYTGQHVLISPRRFGGLSLPMQEACAAGMPVVAPAISPNVDWLPADWLIPANYAGQFTAHTLVDLYSTDVEALADKIEQMATDHAYYRNASAQAAGIGKALSWDNLKPEYERVLNA